MTKEALDRYEAAMHAVQSGVAYEMPINKAPTEPKHLRVGINSAMVEHYALAKLLMDKGVITTDEYEEALAMAAEAEKKRYEDYLSALMGSKVTLA